MIAAIQYQFKGAEVDGQVYIHPMGGHRCLDVIFKGYSLEIGADCLVDETTGAVQILLATARTDELLVLFTTLPRFFDINDQGHDFVVGDENFSTDFY